MLSENIILWYLATALRFRSVMLCPNLITLRSKGRNHLLKELEQLKHSQSMKSVAANKVTTK